MSCLEKDEYVLGKDVDMFFQCLFNSGGTSNKNNHYAKISIPDTNEEPFSLKLIQSKFVAFPEQPYRIPPVKEDDEPYAFYVPGVKEISILFPAFSSLNQKEQSILYHYQCLQYFKVRKLTESENAEFKELLKKANNDFSAYQSFVHNQWVRHHYKRSLQILPGVQMFTDHLWHTKAKQCLGLYPECYKLIDGIPLALNDPNGDWAVLDCWKDLMKRGAPPRLTLPKLKKPCILLTEYSDLCKIKEVFPEDKSLKVESICQPRFPVSLDPNVDACLDKFDNIDVVITSSGVKSIVDIDKFNKDWILPVTVKDVFLQDGETRKKIVIIDKKLPPSHMSVHDKNVWHTKIATKWALILNNAPNLLDSYGTTLSTKDERQLMQYDDLMSEDLDLFGENSMPLNRSDQRDIEPRKTSRDSCLRKPQTVSDPNLEECEVFNIKQFMKSTEYKHPSSNVCEQGREERKSEPTSFFSQDGSLPVRQFSDKGINPCNQYMLWQLHKNKHVYMIKQEHRTLNILVRTRIDGKMIYSDKANKRCVEDVCVSSKVELQPEYGASRMTYSELVREYVDLYLRPSAKLVRVRSVGHTNEVMLNEIRSIVEIREALQAKNVSTNKIFDPLYAVLTKLIDFPVGKYLLQHSAKMGAFTQLMVEDPKGLNFYMPKYCCELRSSDVTVPPTQVDPFVITRVHSRDKIPPALFKPCSTHKSSRFFRKSEPSQLPSGRKRKRTKKKKKPISKS